MSPPIRILIADDHTMVRQGLRQICNAETDMEVVGEAADGEEASHLAAHIQPDVIIMDINMPPGMDGCVTMTKIHELCDAYV